MPLDYAVRIKVGLDHKELAGDAGRVISAIEQMTQRASVQIGRLSSAGSGGSSAARLQQQQAREAERSAKEIDRINTQSRRQAEANDRLLERAAKTLSDTRIREAKRAATETIKALEQERRARTEASRAAERSASQQSSIFSKFLGGAFFANLGAQAVSSLINKLQDLPKEATRIASETQNALKGLESVSIFKGIDQRATQDAVQNLRFVRGGIVSLAEASTSLKNLLSTGFSLPEAITLLERFSDASAFGKQAALDYGQAIRGATEGIKNQNSLLVDNVGITKNLSVILKERGFQLQDLGSKTDGVAARQALYNGLLAESQAQVGDADKILNSYTGTVAANDLAYHKLYGAIGQILISNPELIRSTQLVTEQVGDLTTGLSDASSESARLANEAASAFAKIQASAIPAAGRIVGLIRIIGNALGALVLGALSGAAQIAEGFVNAFANVGTTITNGVISVINGIETVLDKVGLKGALGVGGKVDYITPPTVDFGGAALGKGAADARDEISRLAKQIEQLGVEGSRAWAEIEQTRAVALGRARARAEGFEDPYLERSQATSRSRADQALEASRRAAAAQEASATDAAGKRQKAASQIVDEADKFSIRELDKIQDFFRQATGRSLPLRIGQTPLHNRLGYDHRNAADAQVNPNSPEGRLLVNYLRANEIPFRASTGPERNAAGRTISTGAHVHIGENSRGFGRNTRSVGQTRRDDLINLALSDGRVIRVDPTSLEGAISGAGFTPRFDERGRREGFNPAGGVATTAGTDRVFGADRLVKQLTPVEEAIKESNERISENARALIIRQMGFASELANVEKELAIERETRNLDTVRRIEESEIRLRDLRRDATDDQLTDQRRLLQVREEELDLTERLISLQDESANLGANAGLRVQIAAQEELLVLRRENFEAVEDSARASVRLADQTVFSADRANASVLDFLASQRSVTDVISDARIGVIQSTYDLIDRGLDRATAKLGALGGVLKDVISGFVRLALNKAFATIFGGSTGGSGGGIGFGGGGTTGGGGGIFGNILGNVFGGGGRGGSGNFINPTFATGGGNAAGLPVLNTFAGANLTRLLGGGGSSAATLQSASPTARGGLLSNLGSLLGFGGGGNTASASSRLSVGSLVKSLGPALGGLAPLLGLQLGAQRGGVLGGAGGLLLGGAATAALAPSLLTGLFGGSFGIAGASGAVLPGTAFGLGPAVAGLLSNPFTLAAGAGLLIGGLLLSRNAARRRDERTRDALSHDTGTAIHQLIGRAKAGQLGLVEARSSFQEIMARYTEGTRQIKDSKTRRIAEQTRSHFTALLPTLEAAARESDARATARQSIASQLRPTFAAGGAVSRFLAAGGSASRFNPLGYVTGPGTARSDSIAAYFPVARQHAQISHTEYVLDAETTRNITVPRLDAVRANKGRGFADGGAVTGNGAVAGLPALNVSVVMYQNERTATVTLEMPGLAEKIVKTVRADIRSNPSGIPAEIKRVRPNW